MKPVCIHGIEIITKLVVEEQEEAIDGPWDLRWFMFLILALFVV